MVKWVGKITGGWTAKSSLAGKPPCHRGPNSINGSGEIVLFEAPDGQIRLDVRLEQDTVWLTQAQMAELFGKNVRTISEHIRNIFKEKELDGTSVIRNFRITARDGKTYDTQFYNLDVIISVGYRKEFLRVAATRAKNATVRFRGNMQNTHIAVSTLMIIHKRILGTATVSKREIVRRLCSTEMHCESGLVTTEDNSTVGN